jgi:hypothetical protein
MIAETANLATGIGVVKEGRRSETQTVAIKGTGQLWSWQMILREQNIIAGCLTKRLSGKRRRSVAFTLLAQRGADGGAG